MIQIKFFVKRIESKTLPAQDKKDINWEETFYLNLILHNFTYTLEVSVRRRDFDKTTNKNKTVITKKVEKRVYASPSKVRMDKSKADKVETCYPFINFEINDFDEAFKDIILSKDDELIAVELFAEGDFFDKKINLRLKYFQEL